MTRKITNELRLKVMAAMARARKRRERFFRIFAGATDVEYENLLDKHYMRGKK